MVWMPNYVDLTEAKSFLRLTDAVDDIYISTCISSASRTIDRVTRRQFGNEAVAVSREYRINRGRFSKPYVPIDDIYSLDDMVVTLDGTTVTDDVELFPLNALSNGKVYEDIELPYYGEKLVITALWGWGEIPEPIRHATLLFLNRFFSRRDAPFGVIGSAELGNQMMIARNDPDIRTITNSYYRWW